MDKLHRVACDGVEIEYEAHGAGEHVVLVHHGVGIDWFTPLLEEPALSGRFCVVHYHRPGYGGSGPLIGPLTFEREAVTFRAFMRAIGVARTECWIDSGAGDSGALLTSASRRGHFLLARAAGVAYVVLWTERGRSNSPTRPLCSRRA